MQNYAQQSVKNIEKYKREQFNVQRKKVYFLIQLRKLDNWIQD